MGLKEQLAEDLKSSLKAGDKLKLSVIRMLISDIKNAEIKKIKALTDDELVEVIQHSVKQRRESIEQFKQGNRQDLVDKEEAELKILQGYLPQQFTEQEVRTLVDEAVKQTSAATPRDMGKVMAALMPKVKGRADNRMVSQLVKDKLSG
jgi:uncharacterized protein YqeY